MSTQLLENNQIASAPGVEVSEPSFNSLTPEKLAQLETLFQDKHVRTAINNALAAASGVAVLSAGGAFATTGTAGADAAANAKTTIASGVTNAIDMIKAIDGIGLAAFGVALAPMGFMVTLRVLNMVLSRV